MFDARKIGIALAACAVLGVSATRAPADVLDFQSGLGPFEAGHGLGLQTVPLGGFILPFNGYNQLGFHTGHSQVVFNIQAASSADFIRTDGKLFDLNGFSIAGAFGSQTLTFEGLKNNAVVDSTNLFVDYGTVGRNSNVQNVFDVSGLGWKDIDDFRILTGSDFTLNPRFSGDPNLSTTPTPKEWALDNLNIDLSSTPPPPGTPEPGTLALLIGMGVAGAVKLRRKPRP